MKWAIQIQKNDAGWAQGIHGRKTKREAVEFAERINKTGANSRVMRKNKQNQWEQI